VIDENALIYSRDIERSIQTNLFTPIERVQDCIANGIPVKRGIMLGGSYGTGKTLAARVASKKAVDNGLTFVCVLRADELDDAINFAKLYSSPATVLFCEDIDRALAGERTVRIDDILNTIDGIDSKNQNLITVLTSNHLDDVNPAMLRPGRLDAIIEVTAPDAEATARLIRLYAGKALNASEDITSAASRLAEVGTIPAVIAEVVKRAKLSELAMSARGTVVTNLSAAALDDAAFTMKTQNELLARAIAPKGAKPAIEQALGDLIRRNAGDQRLVGAEMTLPNGSKANLEGRVACVN
jgi:transitional endoplasmic reticulum ATPase